MPLFEINGRRILFIHVPKNAGTSITSLLSQYSEARLDAKLRIYGKTFRPRHLHGELLEQMIHPGMIDYAFMVVRHPLARMFSEYHYQRRPGTAGIRWQRLTGFEAWLDYSLWRSSLDPGYWENHFRPQSSFECFDCEVFRLEDGLDAMSHRLSEVTGQPIGTAPTLNSHPRSHPVLGRSIRAKISRRYGPDLYRYGYEVQLNAC
jgi:hypothetical protein